MNVKVVIVSLVIGSALLGCDQASKGQDVPANWLSVPTLPIIQDAIISLAPTFNGHRDGLLSQQLCALATGQASQDQVNEQLRRLSIDPTRLPVSSNDAVSLLVNGNTAAQVIACATYQSTEVLRPLDMREFTKPAANEHSAGDDKQREKSEPETEKTKTSEIDAGRLAQALPLRVAQARANADVFALIAEQLQRKPGLSVQEYRDKARDLFIRLAPTYLERVRQQMPLSNASYQVIQLDNRHLVFGNNLGTHFDYSVDNGLVLSQNGLVWYGRGQLMGTVYRLQTAYFSAEVAKLLTDSKSE
ncbi:hypothetical protein [Pseudomonas nicosulfuronedens]